MRDRGGDREIQAGQYPRTRHSRRSRSPRRHRRASRHRPLFRGAWRQRRRARPGAVGRVGSRTGPMRRRRRPVGCRQAESVAPVGRRDIMQVSRPRPLAVLCWWPTGRQQRRLVSRRPRRHVGHQHWTASGGGLLICTSPLPPNAMRTTGRHPAKAYLRRTGPVRLSTPPTASGLARRRCCRAPRNTCG